MVKWTINPDGTVTLHYKDGVVIVKKEDFDRAFGTMINSSKQDVKRDYGL